MRILFIWLCILILGPPLLAQDLQIHLRYDGDPMKGLGYQIKEVLDLRVSKQQIGQVHALGNVKRNIAFKAQLDQTVKNFFHSAIQQIEGSSQSIQVRIYEVKVSEKKASNNNLYEGDFQLVIGFYKMGIGEPVHLVDYNGSAQYKRSINRLDMIENVVNRVFKNSVSYFDTWMKLQVMENRHLARTVRLEIIDQVKPSHRDTVYYDVNRPLQWSDFRDKPQRSSRFNASIFTSFSMQGKSMIEAGEIVQRIEIDVYMLPEQSWVKNPSDYALNHEQRHFDVVRVVADRLITKLKNLDLDPDWYEATINDAFFDAYREMNRLQEIYDKQTRHGMDIQAQEEWNGLLDEALKGNWAGIDRVLSQ